MSAVGVVLMDMVDPSSAANGRKIMIPAAAACFEMVETKPLGMAYGAGFSETKTLLFDRTDEVVDGLMVYRRTR